jgi:hypothetical protein
MPTCWHSSKASQPSDLRLTRKIVEASKNPSIATDRSCHHRLTGPTPEQLLQFEGHRRRPLMAHGSGKFPEEQRTSQGSLPGKKLRKKNALKSFRSAFDDVAI